MFLDHLFSNSGFGNIDKNNNNKNNSSPSGLGNESSFFNPFAAIFGTNNTDFGMMMMENNSSLDSNATATATPPTRTVIIVTVLKILI